MKQVLPKRSKITVEPRTTLEDIRARAYELFEARGGEAGDELQDWLRAEKELSERMGRTVAA